MINADVTRGPGSFDSEFRTSMMNSTTNAELTLVLKLHLDRVMRAAQPTIQDADGTTFHVLDWPAQRWEQFKRNFRWMGQRYWSGKFWLRSPQGTTDLQIVHGGRTYQCNVWCRLRIEILDTAAGAHQTIRCVRVRSNGEPMTAGSFRSHAQLYDQYDLGVGTYVRDGRTYSQRTFVHEIGHALGLGHVGEITGNAACPAANTNADECYGTTHEEREDIMGFGHRLRPHHSTPWANRIHDHVRDTSFIGPPLPFTTEMTRAYPTVI